MTAPDRDRSLEQWLRHTPSSGARPDDCLEPEMLAAWAEGLIDGPERAAVESHAAGCARCQAMLAVMVRTAPAASPATRWFSQKRMMMLGPAIAAAAAVVLWVAVDRGMRSVPPASEAAASVTPTAASVPPPLEKDATASRDSRAGADGTIESALAAGRADERADAATTAKESKQMVAPLLQSAPVNEPEAGAAAMASTKPKPPAESVPLSAGSPTGAVPAPATGPAPQQQVNQTASNQSEFGQLQANQAQASRTQANASSVNQGQVSQTASGQALRAEQAEQAKKAEEQSPKRPAAVADQLIVTSEKDRTPVATPAPAAAAARPRSPGVGGRDDSAVSELRRAEGLAARVGHSAEVTAPDNSVRWRVDGGRVVLQSGDKGATWTTSYTAGENVELTAGAAGSPTVCWFVGRAGVVILTTDGQQWRTVKFPERTDLVAVTASGTRSASVTTAGGRVFATADGGATWTRR